MVHRERTLTLQIRVGQGAAVRGALAQLERDPRDRAAIKRLVNALCGAHSTEDGDVVAKFD